MTLKSLSKQKPTPTKKTIKGTKSKLSSPPQPQPKSKKQRKYKHKYLAVDTETTGLHLFHGCEAFMVTACSDSGDLYIFTFDVDVQTRAVLYNKAKVLELYKLLESAEYLVFHNRTFDLRGLSLIDDSIADLLLEKKTHDTIIMAHIIDNLGSLGLKPLAKHYLGFSDEDEKDLKDAVMKAQRIGKKLGWLISQEGLASIPDAGKKAKYHNDYWLPREVAIAENYEKDHPWYTVCEKYALKDVERTMGLFLSFQECLSKKRLTKVYDTHNQVYKSIYGIKSRGLTILLDEASGEYGLLCSKMDALEKTITKLTHDGFNPNSTIQLQKLLHETYKLPIVATTDKGNAKTDAKTLEYHHEILKNDPKLSSSKAAKFLQALLELNKLQTTASYLDSYLSFTLEHPDAEGYGKLHPNINQTGTSTTRVSSNDPNGQNIGKGDEEYDEYGNKIVKYSLRKIFGPPPGKVWYAWDYSSLQLIIFAYESGDKAMIQAFESGADIHNLVARAIFETNEVSEFQRRIAKNINYGLIFGAKKHKIDATANKVGAYERFADLFPSVPLFMPRVIEQVKKTGKVHTAWGYPLHVDQTKPYVGVNYIIQGDEGEIVKRAMIGVESFLSKNVPEVRLIMQIHDELLFEVDEGFDFPCKEIATLMTKPGTDIGWKLSVDGSIIRNNWASKEKIKWA